MYSYRNMPETDWFPSAWFAIHIVAYFWHARNRSEQKRFMKMTTDRRKN